MKIFNTLYHVTTDDRLESISFKGVDPEYSEGARAVSWYVNDKGVVWACLHVAERRRITPDRMIVCVVNVPEDSLKRTRWNGVFTTNTAFIPANYSTVTAALRDYEAWLVAIENEAKRAGQGA